MLLKQFKRYCKLARQIFCKQKFTREGGVDFQMTDAEVQKVIRRKVDESVESAFGIEKRIDKFGVTQPNIQN
jgi:SecD/SecF fusion protein